MNMVFAGEILYYKINSLKILKNAETASNFCFPYAKRLFFTRIKFQKKSTIFCVFFLNCPGEKSYLKKSMQYALPNLDYISSNTISQI